MDAASGAALVEHFRVVTQPIIHHRCRYPPLARYQNGQRNALPVVVVVIFVVVVVISGGIAQEIYGRLPSGLFVVGPRLVRRMCLFDSGPQAAFHVSPLAAWGSMTALSVSLCACKEPLRGKNTFHV